MHAADIAGVRFLGTRVPVASAIGGEGNGFGVVQKALRISRGGIGALASGAASAVFEATIGYARARNVFGAPILAFGAIADHVMRIAALDRIVAATALRGAMLASSLGVGAAPATAVAKYACCVLAEEAVTEGRRVLASRALVEELGFARIVRDVLLYSVFDGTSHVMLDELAWRLTQLAAASDAGEHALDATRAAYAAKPRHTVIALRSRARVDLTPLGSRLRALAAIASPLDVSPLAEAAEALMDVTRAARASGRWDAGHAGQGLRFDAADAFARLEALTALVELGDPPRREALGIPPLGDPFDAAVTAYAVAWFGARTSERVTRVALACEAEAPCARSFAATRTLLHMLPGARGAMETAFRE
jgi:alkylation response protein AidB-like acyl-CoA dehydrogenase